MLMMASASVAIGMLPTFESIGLAASLLLLLARIIQGFAHGGESATANSYIAEIAPARKRGLWGSAVFMTIFGGAFLAFVLGGVITGALSEPQVQAWGWRIPFLLGAVLAVVALWLRIGMVESQVFQEGTDDEDPAAADPAAAASAAEAVPADQQADRVAEVGSAAPAAEAVTRQADRVAVRDGLGEDSFSADTLKPLSPALSIVLIFFLVSGVAASNYTWTSYVSTYAQTQEGMSPSGAYWALVAALVVGLASLPFWGAVSDRWGRKPVLYVFAVGTIVTVFPLMGGDWLWPRSVTYCWPTHLSFNGGGNDMLRPGTKVERIVDAFVTVARRCQEKGVVPILLAGAEPDGRVADGRPH